MPAMLIRAAIRKIAEWTALLRVITPTADRTATAERM
jgi:hypothetical protein